MPPIRSSSLRFDELRDANVRRLPEFKNPKGEVADRVGSKVKL